MEPATSINGPRLDPAVAEGSAPLVAATCQDQDVKAIAEEMNLDALELHGAKQSVCEQIADSFYIPHRYCDPSIKEQKKLGIDQPDNIRMTGFFAGCDQSKIEAKVNASLAARRGYWLEQLLKLDAWPVLFICGADHTEPFRALLQANRYRRPVCYSQNGHLPERCDGPRALAWEVDSL